MSGPAEVEPDRAALDRAVDALLGRQRPDGAWEGEVVWCTMILSQYVIVQRVALREITSAARQRILRHYSLTRTPEGGWPLHPEGPPQVFTTALAYVALRLLGVEAGDERAARAREWLLHQPGGILGIPTWGKFWLSLIGLYGRDGVGALPPELFLLPAWLPFHPRRWYCHTRYIYVAMAYLYGRGFEADLGAVGAALRSELYPAGYDAADFRRYRAYVADTDLYAEPHRLALVARRMLAAVERWIPAATRARALDFCLDRIVYEQRVTSYQALSPVNGLLNCLALLAEDRAHPDLGPSLAGLEAWKWTDADEGTRYAGARSQVWDTAFAARAVAAAVDAGSRSEGSPDVPASGRVEALRRAHRYLAGAQMSEELPDGEAEQREPILGGWCFSDGAHRWPVSDCAAEALTAILAIEQLPGVVPAGARIPAENIRRAAAFLLARQNGDGGFSTYEPQRGGAWLSRLNPAEMFRDCMIDRSYVECTASAVEALATIRATHTDLFTTPMALALSRGLAFLRAAQQADGSWPSAWGIQFTYGVFHALKAAKAAGLAGSDPMVERAATWLRETQRHDGAWGEHYSGCFTGRYAAHPRGQAVMTGWALLALAETAAPGASLAAGVRWLTAAQSPDGSWPPEAVNGVFFGTAMLDYRLYRAYFPAWALARLHSRR